MDYPDNGTGECANYQNWESWSYINRFNIEFINIGVNMREPFKRGDKLRCIAARDERFLTKGNTYRAVRDEEPGIFSDRSYITVTSGIREVTCHASRFEKVV